MNNLSKTLLGGVALVALTAAPAFAHKFHGGHVTSMLGHNNVVNKSKMHNQKATHVTYTYGVYTYQSASAPKKTHLGATFYKWNDSGSLCSAPPMSIKAPKKSVYAKIGTASQTYSIGCTNGPTTFIGDTWTNKTGVAGNTDTFTSTLIGKFHNGSSKYKGTLNLDVKSPPSRHRASATAARPCSKTSRSSPPDN